MTAARTRARHNGPPPEQPTASAYPSQPVDVDSWRLPW